MRTVPLLTLLAIVTATNGCGCNQDGGGAVTAKPISRTQEVVRPGETITDATKRMMKASGGTGIPRGGVANPNVKHGLPK